MFKVFLYLLLLIGTTADLIAEPSIPVEVGVSYAFGDRSEDSLSRGMQKFRSSISLDTQRVTNVKPFPSMDSTEYYFRLGVMDSEHHLIGMSFGKYFIPEVPLLELRSDSVITSTNWSFNLPYFMMTYHYTGQLTGRWNRKLRLGWDGGAGFGFLYGSRWRVNGYSVSRFQNLQYNMNQRGRTGNIARLELGLRRNIWEGMYLRVGLRVSYLTIPEWDGELNSSEGAWYYAKDGSLLPLSSFNLLAFQSLTIPANNALSSSAIVDSKAGFYSGVRELQFSVGYRW